MMGFSFPMFIIGISREEVAIRKFPELHSSPDYEGLCVGNTGHLFRNLGMVLVFES